MVKFVAKIVKSGERRIVYIPREFNGELPKTKQVVVNVEGFEV